MGSIFLARISQFIVIGRTCHSYMPTLETPAPAKRLSKVSSPYMFFILWSGTFDSILAIVLRENRHHSPKPPSKQTHWIAHLWQCRAPKCFFFILWSGTFDSILAIVLRENRHHSPKPPSKQQQELTRSLARPQQLFQASFKVFLVKFDVNHNIIKLCSGIRLRRYWSMQPPK